MSNKSVVIFERKYTDEGLYDLPRDIDECFDERFNKKIGFLKPNEDGFREGTFKVTVQWIPDEDEND
jgi:hypothetical protein